jgi:hypothetical protein
MKFLLSRRWTCGDEVMGESVVDEITPDQDNTFKAINY